ncbi:MAG: ribbon-helix-helix domain-containing protein [Xanthobacteraceae bacterium]
MRSQVVKRSIVIAGHKTSVSLEDAFWTSLKEIAGNRQMTLSDLVSSIDSERQHRNLSSAIRLFVLDHYRTGSNRPSATITRESVDQEALADRRPLSTIRVG